MFVNFCVIVFLDLGKYVSFINLRITFTYPDPDTIDVEPEENKPSFEDFETNMSNDQTVILITPVSLLETIETPAIRIDDNDSKVPTPNYGTRF